MNVLDQIHNIIAKLEFVQEGEGDQTEVFEYEIPSDCLTERARDLPTIDEERLSCLEETPIKMTGPRPVDFKMSPISIKHSAEKKSRQQLPQVEFFECESDEEIELFEPENDGVMQYESVTSKQRKIADDCPRIISINQEVKDAFELSAEFVASHKALED